jgi:hypothetical protein
MVVGFTTTYAIGAHHHSVTKKLLWRKFWWCPVTRKRNYNITIEILITVEDVLKCNKSHISDLLLETIIVMIVWFRRFS